MPTKYLDNFEQGIGPDGTKYDNVYTALKKFTGETSGEIKVQQVRYNQLLLENGLEPLASVKIWVMNLHSFIYEVAGLFLAIFR